MDDTLDLPELARTADVSSRTVRYYIQQGLLPAPDARGPGAHYRQEHLDRLRIIKRLQREHLPLAEIRRRLDALTDDELRVMAREQSRASSARQYLREALGLSAPIHANAANAANATSEPSPIREPSVGSSILAEEARPETKGVARSQWDRITLGPDVELHVRRPLTRHQNRQVERLLDAARHIFEQEVP